MPLVTPMRLLRIPQPFDHPEFVFEPKLDGFRALAHVRGRRCELVSRNGHVFKGWPQIAEEVAHAVRAREAVIDGEICCLEPDGRTQFRKLMFRREWPHFSLDRRQHLHEPPLSLEQRQPAQVLAIHGQQIEGVAGCCTSITWWSVGAICIGWRASVISKA